MRNPEEKKTYSWLLLILLIIALIIGFYTIDTKPKKGAENKEVTTELSLKVIPLKAEDVKVSKNYIGYITPINNVSVQPYIAGFLDKISVIGGEEVNSGDVLVIIEELKNSFTSIEKEYTQNMAYQHSTDNMKNILSLTLDKYKQGLVSFSDLLTAEQDLLNAQNSLITSNGNIYLNIIAFYKAAGGGYQYSSSEKGKSCNTL